jgi:hypothetical protein
MDDLIGVIAARSGFEFEAARHGVRIVLAEIAECVPARLFDQMLTGRLSGGTEAMERHPVDKSYVFSFLETRLIGNGDDNSSPVLGKLTYLGLSPVQARHVVAHTLLQLRSQALSDVIVAKEREWEGLQRLS